MIVYPSNWRMVGRHIRVKDIEAKLYNVIWGIDVNCLSFSGGLDSSLLLYYMCTVKNDLRTSINLFTAARSKMHPDIIHSKAVVKYFKEMFPYIDFKHYILYILKDEERNGIKLFYEWVLKHTDRIIAGDGIDEFMCGYYDYQTSLDREGVYYDRLSRLRKDHLIPLNEVSGGVMVYLPYIDEGLITLYSQIPLSEKVDDYARKKVMLKLAKGKVPDEVLLRRKYGFCDVT